MPDSPAVLRKLVQNNRPNKHQPGYPDTVRRRVAQFVHQQRRLDVTFTVLAQQLGLSNSTLSQWEKKYATVEPSFLPVHIKDTRVPVPTVSTPISIISPQGWIIKGLDLNALTAIIGSMK